MAKGERKGWFELGGSTVVLVFEQNAILFDADLCANSAAGIETYVHLGESVGRAGRKPAAVYTAAGLPRPARAEVHG